MRVSEAIIVVVTLFFAIEVRDDVHGKGRRTVCFARGIDDFF